MKLSFYNLLLSFLSIPLYAQPSASKSITGQLDSNSGTIQYRATVEISADLSNIGKDLVDISLCRQVTSFEILSYEYNGVNAADIGFSFPLSKNYKEDVEVEVRFFKGKASKTINATIGGCGPFSYDINYPKDFLDHFGIKYGGAIVSVHEGYTTQFNDLSLKIIWARLSSDLYIDELDEMQTAIRKKVDLEKRIQKLQYELTNTNEETKINVQKKKRLYIELSEIDTSTDYSGELEKIEKKLKEVAWDELEEEESSSAVLGGIVIKSSKKNETKEEKEDREEYEQIKEEVSKEKEEFDRRVEYMMLMTDEANRLYNQVIGMDVTSFDRVNLLRTLKNGYLQYLTPAQQEYVVNTHRGALPGALAANAASHDWGYGDRYFGMTINTGANILGGEISKFAVPLITYIEINIPISDSFLLELIGEYSLNWVLKQGDTSKLLEALGEDTSGDFTQAPSIFDDDPVEVEENKYSRFIYGLGFNFGWSRAVSLQLLGYNTKFYHHYTIDGETEKELGQKETVATYGLGLTIDPWNGKEKNGLSRFSFSYTTADKSVKFLNPEFEFKEIKNLNFRYDGASGAFYYALEYNTLTDKMNDFSLSTVGIKLGFYIGLGK